MYSILTQSRTIILIRIHLSNICSIVVDLLREILFTVSTINGACIKSTRYGINRCFSVKNTPVESVHESMNIAIEEKSDGL